MRMQAAARHRPDQTQRRVRSGLRNGVSGSVVGRGRQRHVYFDLRSSRIVLHRLGWLAPACRRRPTGPARRLRLRRYPGRWTGETHLRVDRARRGPAVRGPAPGRKARAGLIRLSRLALAGRGAKTNTSPAFVQTGGAGHLDHEEACGPAREARDQFTRTAAEGGAVMAEPVPSGSDVSAGTYKCTNCGNTVDVGSTQASLPARVVATATGRRSAAVTAKTTRIPAGTDETPHLERGGHRLRLGFSAPSLKALAPLGRSTT